MTRKNVFLIGGLLLAGLFIGWSYPQNAPNGWDYKITQVTGATQGEQTLREMDSEGWEFIAVQSLRTEAVLTPKLQLIQNRPAPFTGDPQAVEAQSKSPQPEALYFFRRAKKR